MFGVLVRTRRQRSGITQEELADRSGISVRTIRDIEAGRVRGSRPSTVRRLATALGLDGAERDHFTSCAFAAGTAADPAPVAPASADPPPLPPAADPGRVVPASADPVPAQLPPSLSAFAGRAEQLRQLDAVLLGGPGVLPPAGPVCVVTGPAGVGKTTLAVRWSHRVRDRFDGGQLYANLRGFGPDRLALDPAEVLRGFLDALGVPPAQVPVGQAGQVALYRSLLADRRVLIVLDNARDAAQVRPLLPGTSGCRVLVTSRNRLTGLVATEGAHPLPLDLLTPADARLLLARRIGEARVQKEPEAVARVLGYCHRLPIALAVVAARVATQRSLRLATVAEDFATQNPLDACADEDGMTDVRTVFSWSYRILAEPAARMFRLLALHPGPDLSVDTAAGLADVPPRQARALLAELTRTHLVEQRPGNRYAQHDLLRAYAAELTEQLDAAPLRQAATRRMFDGLLRTATTAAQLLEPDREPLPGAPVDRAEAGPTDSAQAADWFAAERPGLLALIRTATARGLDGHAWRLAAVSATYLQRQGYWSDQLAAQQIGLAATVRLADEPGQSLCHRGAARALLRLRRFADAEEHLRRSLVLARRHGDVVGQARSEHSLGYAAQERDDHRSALRHHHRSLRLFTVAAHEPGRAETLNSIAWSLAVLGRHRSALAFAGESLAVLRLLGDRHGEGNTLDTLGYIRFGLGEHAAAVTCYRQAIELFQEVGDRLLEADSWRRLAEVYARAGEQRAAEAAARAAADLQDALEQLRRPTVGIPTAD